MIQKKLFIVRIRICTIVVDLGEFYTSMFSLKLGLSQKILYVSCSSSKTQKVNVKWEMVKRN